MNQDKYPNKRNKKTAEEFRVIYSRFVWWNPRKQFDGSVIVEYRFEGAPNTTWEAELSPEVVAELGNEFNWGESFTTETLLEEYQRQDEILTGYNQQLWQTDRPADEDWHELMGMRDSVQEILEELEEEINRRAIYKNKDGIFVHVAYDPDRPSKYYQDENED